MRTVKLGRVAPMMGRAAPALSGCLALIIGCGAAPKGIRHAQSLMEKGDYAGAERAADTELARYPKHPVLWRIKIQAPLERGDSAQAVERYKQWHHIRKHYDETAMRAMAITTLDRALRETSAAVRRSAVRAVARMSEDLDMPEAEILIKFMNGDVILRGIVLGVAASFAGLAVTNDPSGGEL